MPNTQSISAAFKQLLFFLAPRHRERYGPRYYRADKGGARGWFLAWRRMRAGEAAKNHDVQS